MSLHALCELPAALRRLVVRRLAETEVGSPRSLSRRESEAICSLGPGGTKTLDLGEGLRAVAEYGMLRLVKALDAAPPRAVELSVPGRARFGSWEVEARVGAPGDVAVAGAALGPRAVVRSWREGDRMRPIGLGGSKTLQDLFTDRKVPRSLRSTLPVVEADGAIVWVAGVALDERFAARDGDGGAVGLSARSLG
ncbi:MAG: tRNA lysidine(34) synthetase TilS [Thermoleophilaceae bacterium]|nr:tRNA lysidine(34) synthetase TilS [Thermoleophilaceae bacterium]